MKFNVRSMTLIGMMATATIAVNLFFYHIFFFVFLIVILSLKQKESLIYAFVVAFVNFVSYISMFTFLNVVLLPLTALVLLAIRDLVFGSDTMLEPSTQHKVIFCLGAFVVILASNVFYDVIRLMFYSGTSFSLTYLWVSFPYSFLIALVNPILMLVVGFTIAGRMKETLNTYR